MKVRNTFIIFLVSGFWHGANWTFIAWGFLNALYIMPSILFKTNRQNLDTVAQGKLLPSLKEFGLMSFTFFLTVIAWIFFRAESIQKAFQYIGGIFSHTFTKPDIFPTVTILLVLFFILIEWLGREQNYAIANFGFRWPRIFRLTFYYALIISIFIFMGAKQQFIYFQF